jgi:thiol-disulfide isomerase/thioredoxin
MTTFPSEGLRVAPRRFRKRWLLYAVGGVLLALVALRLFFMWSFDRPLPPNLATVRELQVTLPNGQAGLLGDPLRPGVPTIISLWASWCGPCFQEAPKIAELRRKFGPEKLNVVYLNVRDPYATPEGLAAYMTRFSMPADGYVVMKDLHRLSDLTQDAENLIPRTLVFDRTGEPIATIVGYKPLALSRVEGLIAD